MTTAIASNWATRPLRMFTGAEQFDNFSRLAFIFPARVVRRSDHARPIPRAIQQALPRTYYFNNRERSSAEFLAKVDTAGLLVIKQGALVREWYIDPLQATRQWPSWSVVKSIVSCLIGIAVAEHAIDSILDAVTRYVPALCGSAYDAVCIERSARVMTGIGSRDELAMSTKRARAPGTYHQYNSNDTQVLGMVLRAATGKNLSRLLQEKLWTSLGMQDDAFFLVDSCASSGLRPVCRPHCATSQNSDCSISMKVESMVSGLFQQNGCAHPQLRSCLTNTCM